MVAKSGSGMTLTLPTDKELVLTRIFDAPRSLVFEAAASRNTLPAGGGPGATPRLWTRWTSGRGGEWRFLNRDQEGNEFAFNGVYREIVPPERIVQTFEFERVPGHISTETLTLEDLGGKTRLTARAVFDTKADRDGMLGSGMEEGAAETYDRLGELLEIMRAERAAR